MSIKDSETRRVAKKSFEKQEVSYFISLVVAGGGLFQLCMSEPVFPRRDCVKLVLTKISLNKSLNHWGL